MTNELPVVAKLKTEFAKHVSASPDFPFRPKADLSLKLVRTVRELETKRQLGNLTAEERLGLKAIDELYEDMAKFNQRLLQKPAGTGHAVTMPVYDLRQGSLGSETPYQNPVIIPSISPEEADKIISNLNKQFRDKVLAKLKRPPRLDRELPVSPKSQGLPQEPGLAIPGRSLEDYLAKLRAEPPSLPFLDEDSHTDLSKLKFTGA